MSWMHRSCTEQIRSLEGELRKAHRREVDHTLAVAALRSEREREESARWDAAGEAEVLRDRVDALEKELAERRHADSEPARRRARAAWRTLWDQRGIEPWDRPAACERGSILDCSPGHGRGRKAPSGERRCPSSLWRCPVRAPLMFRPEMTRMAR